MPKLVFSEEMGRYFSDLKARNAECYDIAKKARQLGRDPQLNVEIPQAEDLASRVEKLLSDYKLDGIAEEIRELTDEYHNREIVSLKIAEKVAERTDAKTQEERVDRAIRAGLAVLTEGILVAPLEGIAQTRVRSNPDGTNYIDLMFAGPIRAAGGTAQAMSVLIADMVRQKLGIGKYIPTKEEVERLKEEIPLYKQEQHLQYMPTPHEIEIIVGKCPICMDGEGTEKVEVSGFRDLPRIEDNRVRSGPCLVISEGMCLKASKLKKHVDKLKIQGWEFLQEYLDSKGMTKTEEQEAKKEVTPSSKYLIDMVAGRPIFGHPSRVGAFRLRYGRGRTCGLASLAFNPASMAVLGDFPALGTQVKIERPGKACVVTPCDQLEGPTVVLRNGDFIQCQTRDEVYEIKNVISEIVDTGEILIPYGEFSENNHFLVPCGYPIEWHRLELEQKGELPSDWEHPTFQRALEMSKTLNVPLHPDYNLYWSDFKTEERPVSKLKELRAFVLANGKYTDLLIIPREASTKRTLEDLGALHRIVEGNVHVDRRYSEPLLMGLGLWHDGDKITSVTEPDGNNGTEYVNKAYGIEVRARAMTRIGTRMGRPEKAKDRRANSGLIHGLFPVTESPECKCDLQLACKTFKETKKENAEAKGLKIDNKENVLVEMGRRVCPECQNITYRTWCRECNVHTEALKSDERKGIPVDLDKEFHDALKLLGTEGVKEIKVLDKLKSASKTPEALEKAILRAQHDIITYKDGTVRFDMTDIPITHFRPREIGMSLEKAHKLGYTHDWNDEPLTDANQLCELKVQDVIPNSECGTHLVKVAGFIDDLLEKFYNQKRYYNAEKKEDIIGQLGIGLAPHTSGGILCRIIGYTEARGCYAHPFFHASKRRNCDGDEDCVMLLLDGLLNFSRAYIPSSRGGLMDTPLVLTTRLDPNEIDKEAHNVDCLRRYPLEFYKAAMEMQDAKEVEKIMDLIGGRIGTEKQYEGLGFTHDTTDISEGPKQSAYIKLESMPQKMDGQLELGKKIRAVDEKDVAVSVINKHFMPDMIGNLRSFSTQTLRCTRCGAKYRRIPLTGKCTCGNNLVLTVHEASVKKYLQISKDVCEKYDLPEYTKERVEILSLSMDSLFNNDKIKKCKLSDFF